jgi:hypothetical protein
MSSSSSSSWQSKSSLKFENLLLIACKCTPLYKKLDCNAKNEPLYLATTLLGLAIKKNTYF